MKKLILFLLVVVAISTSYALGEKVLYVKVDNLNDNWTTRVGRAVFEFSTILFAPNDDMDWDNHISTDSRKVELNGKLNFRVSSRGWKLSTLHRVSFLSGNVEIYCKSKNAKGKKSKSLLIAVEYYSKKYAKKLYKEAKAKGLNVRLEKLNGATIKVRKKESDTYMPYYIPDENVIYYIDSRVTKFIIDASSIK